EGVASRRRSAFQLRHHLAREQTQALLGDLVGHAAVAEHAAERLAAGALDRVDDLVVELLRWAPGREAQEKPDPPPRAARLADSLLRRLVRLVTAQLRHMVADQLVVADY